MEAIDNEQGVLTGQKKYVSQKFQTLISMSWFQNVKNQDRDGKTQNQRVDIEVQTDKVKTIFKILKKSVFVVVKI